MPNQAIVIYISHNVRYFQHNVRDSQAFTSAHQWRSKDLTSVAVDEAPAFTSTHQWLSLELFIDKEGLKYVA